MGGHPPPLPGTSAPDAPPPLPAHLLDEPRVLPAGAAVQWVKTGWQMFTAAPGPWLGIVLVFVLGSALLNAIPFVGILNIVLQPILGAGLISACEAQRTGGRPRIQHLFAGFHQQTGALALVGVIYTIAVMLVVVLVGGGGFAAMLPFILAGSLAGDQFSMSPAMIGIIALCVLVAMALVVPLGMAAWWAPALVYLHHVPPVEALKRGLSACVRNWLAVVVFVLLTIVLLVATVISLGLGLLLLGPVLIIAMWAAYREVFVA